MNGELKVSKRLLRSLRSGRKRFLTVIHIFENRPNVLYCSFKDTSLNTNLIQNKRFVSDGASNTNYPNVLKSLLLIQPKHLQ